MPGRPFKMEGVMTQTSKVAQNDAKELMQMDFFFFFLKEKIIIFKMYSKKKKNYKIKKK